MSITESIQIEVKSQAAEKGINDITKAFDALIKQVNAFQQAFNTINQSIANIKPPNLSDFNNQLNEQKRTLDDLAKASKNQIQQEQKAIDAKTKSIQKQIDKTNQQASYLDKLARSNSQFIGTSITGWKEYKQSVEQTTSSLKNTTSEINATKVAAAGLNTELSQLGRNAGLSAALGSGKKEMIAQQKAADELAAKIKAAYLGGASHVKTFSDSIDSNIDKLNQQGKVLNRNIGLHAALGMKKPPQPPTIPPVPPAPDISAFSKLFKHFEDGINLVGLFGGGLSKLMRGFNLFMTTLRNVTRIITLPIEMLQQYVSGMVTLVKWLYTAGLELNKFRTTMTVVTGTVGAANDEVSWLREETNRLGVSFKDAAVPFAKFSAAAKDTFDKEQIRGVFSAFSEASVALHLTGTEINGVFYALQQMVSKGKVSSEELRRQLAERIPGAMVIAAKSYGMTMLEFDKALKDGIVYTQDFLEKYAKAISEYYGSAAKVAADSTVGAFTRMQNSWEFFKQDLAESGPFVELGNVFDAISSKLKELGEYSKQNGSQISKILEQVTSAIRGTSVEQIEEIFNSYVKGLQKALESLPTFINVALKGLEALAKAVYYFQNLDELFDNMSVGAELTFGKTDALEKYKTTLEGLNQAAKVTGVSIKDMTEHGIETNAFIRHYFDSDGEKEYIELIARGNKQLKELKETYGLTEEQINSFVQTGVIEAAKSQRELNDELERGDALLRAFMTSVDVHSENMKTYIDNTDEALAKLRQEQSRPKVDVYKTDLENAKKTEALNKEKLATIREELRLQEQAVSAITKRYNTDTSLQKELDKAKEDKIALTHRESLAIDAVNKARSQMVDIEKKIADESEKNSKKRIEALNKELRLQQQLANLISKGEIALSLEQPELADDTFTGYIQQLGEVRAAYQSVLDASKELQQRGATSSSKSGLSQYQGEVQELASKADILNRELADIKGKIGDIGVNAQKYKKDMDAFFERLSKKDVVGELQAANEQFKNSLDIVQLQEGVDGRRKATLNQIAKLQSDIATNSEIYKQNQEQAQELNQRALDLITRSEALAKEKLRINQETIKGSEQYTVRMTEYQKLEAKLNEDSAAFNEDSKQFKIETANTQGTINELKKEEIDFSKEIAELEQKQLLARLQIKQALEDEWNTVTLGSYIAKVNELVKAYGFAKNEAKEIAEDQRLLQFFKEAQLSVDDLSGSFSDMFLSVLKDGESFTDALASMWENMMDRILEASLNLVLDNAFSLLLSGGQTGSWTQLLTGAVGVGAAYLFGGRTEPKREDIKDSITTRTGDDRALGYAQQVAADIASRDHFYALQLEAFKQMQQDLKTSVTVMSNAVAGSKDTFFKWFDDVGNIISSAIKIELPDSIKNIADAVSDGFSSLLVTNASNALAYTNTGTITNTIAGLPTGVAATGAYPYSPISEMSPVTTEFDASSIGDKLPDVISVLGAAYGIYSLIANWKEMSTADKVINTISTLATTITTGITVAAQAGVAAAQGMASVVPVVGWVIAGLTAAYQGITAALSGNQRLATDYFTTAGFGGMNKSMFGNTGGGIVNALTVGPASLISGLFSKPRTPKVNLDTIWSERMYGMDATTPSELAYQPVEGTDYYWKSKGDRLATITPFGRVGVQPRNFEMSKSAMIESFAPLLDIISETDQVLANTLNDIDFKQGRTVINRFGQEVGETMNYYQEWLSDLNDAGKYFNLKQKAKKFDSAKALEFRYDKIIEVIGASETEVGVAIESWYNLFDDKFGSENTLGLIQTVATNIEALMALPTNLVQLLDDNIKSISLGGTPEQAVEEMSKVVGAFGLLSIGLDSLGANISDFQIVEFLAQMNGIGFAVEDAGNSIYQYATVLKSMDLDIAEGISNLIAYADAQKFTNTQMTNFITTVGAFSVLGKELGLKTTEQQLKNISVLIGEMATATLDQSELKSLEDQATQYGGLTVVEARAEIEKLGLATGDAILDVVNQTLLLEKALNVSGLSFAELGLNLEQAVKGSVDFIESMGGIDAFEKSLNSFVSNFYTQAEQIDMLAADLVKQFTSLDLGIDVPNTKEEFKNAIEFAAETLNTEAYGALLNMAEPVAQVFDYIEGIEQKRAQMQISLMQAQGKANEALVETRKAELEALKDYPELQDIQQQIYAAEDLIKKRDLEEELMSLQGKDLELLTIQRERELDTLDPVLQAIKSLIYAEEDLIKVRENATRVAEQQKSLDIELLKAKGLTLEATTLERQDWVKEMTDQMDKDITDLIQSQQSSFAASDLQPEDTALSELIRQYVADNNLATIKEIYEAAKEFNIDPYDVGKAFGLTAETTASFLTEAGISGFSVDQDTKDIKDSYENLIDTQQAIWELNDAAEKTKDSLDELNNIEQERIRLQDQIDELTLSYTEKLEKQRNALYEVNRPLFDLLHSLEVARDQHLLDIQLLEVTGKEEEALNMKRQDQLATMDEQLHATQLAIWAAEDAAKAEKDLADARSTALDDAFKVLQKAINTEKEKLRIEYEDNSERIKQSIDTLSESVNNLKSLSESLKSTLESLFPVGGDQLLRRQQAQAEIVSAVAIARAGGPLPLLEDLEKSLNVIREPSEDLFGNFVDYQRDFYKTAISINDLKTLTDDSLSEQETQLDLAKDQLKVLEETYTAEIERLDAILEKYQEQIDAINGVTIAIMTIPEAIANLESVIAGLSFNSGGSSTTTTTPTTPITNLLTPSDSSSLMKNVLMAKLNQATTNQEVSNIASFASKVLPGFAEGGTHTGGWRIVGENGPELEYTAPSHIFSNSQSQSLLNLDELVAEVQALREDVRAGQSAIAANTRKTAKTLDKFDIDGMPEVRT